MLMKRTTQGGALRVPCCVALLLALCAGGRQADASVTLHALGNLTVASCDIVLDAGSDQVKMRGVLASEFDTKQTASIIPFQMIVENCNGTLAGHSFSVTVTGTTLPADGNVFNDDTTDDVGFMLKDNGKGVDGTPNYWPGSIADYYNATPTVVPGQPTQGIALTEDNPLQTQLNFFVGLVTPKTTGGVNAAPRHVKATLTFNVNYQ